MTRIYRKGPIGALMDELERAAVELIQLFERIPQDQYQQILDANTKDENCRSIQTIVSHVVSAGYGYANYIRPEFLLSAVPYVKRPLSYDEAVPKIREMLQFTADTLESKWEMSDEEIESVNVLSRWGSRYDLEQLLEHAIVHVLRHRRQIERLLTHPS